MLNTLQNVVKYNCTLDKLSSRSHAYDPCSCLERVKSLFNHTVRSLHYVPAFLTCLIKPQLSTLHIPSKGGSASHCRGRRSPLRYLLLQKGLRSCSSNASHKLLSLKDPSQPQPFSMPSKLLILHGEVKSYCLAVSCVPESMFHYL